MSSAWRSLTLPEDACDGVFATDGYTARVGLQTPSMSGSVEEGYVAKLSVTI